MNNGVIYKDNIPFNADDYLLFSSEKLQESLAYYSANNYENAVFSYYNYPPFLESSLDVLNQIKVRRLLVHPFNISDLSAINNQHELVRLDIHTDPTLQAIDFDNFPKLETFKGYWTIELKNLFKRDTLKELCLWKYTPSSKDLSEVKSLVNLESLDIIQSNIQSLSGIEGLKNLKRLSIAYDRNLESFGNFPANGNAIEQLEIEVCKKINVNDIKGFTKLKHLDLLNNGKYATLKPLIDNLPSLESLNFGETDLTDIDNSYFLNHPSLKEINFLDKRRYKFSCEELNKALKAKTGKKERVD
jgi:hypothetical protein